MRDNPEVQQRILEIAQNTAEGTISILEAVRLLNALLHEERTLVSQDDFHAIIGIESETDDLPIGHVRAEWAQDALSEKDKEIARCEALWRDQVISICQRIIDRGKRH